MRLHIEPPPVYFMHVPKTGGSSVRKKLRANYSARDHIDLGAPELARITIPELQGFRSYHSWHYGRSMLDLIARGDLAVITMLRTPVERTASGVYYIYRSAVSHPERLPEKWGEQMRPLLLASLSEWLNQDFIAHDLSNQQTRVLGMREDYHRLFKGSLDADTGRTLKDPYAFPALIAPDNVALVFDNARAWLSQMAVVGLTERFGESVLLISDLLGIPAPADLPRANVNPERTDPAMRYRDQLPPEVVARLEELNRYDLELYAHASELFEQQWAHYQARPRRTYSIAAHLRPMLRTVKASVKRFGGRGHESAV